MEDAPTPQQLRNVLLVDDDEFAYHVVSLQLSEIQVASYQVEWRSTYQSGLEALLTGAHDVCLLDYQLGEDSGLALLREAVSRGCNVPVVMLTAQGGHQLDLETMRAGAADYLVKGEFGAPLLERSLRYAIERARTLEALRESEERYALAVQGANDGLWDWKVPGHEVYFSPRWKSIIGCEDAELPNTLEAWYGRVHPEDLERLQKDIAVHLAGESAHLENEHRLLHKDGTFRWVVTRGLAVRAADGKVARLAGSMRDITQSRGHDPLTGLPNRLLYLDRLSRVMERAKRRKDYSYAVLFIDLDRFKILNDSLGHLAGDELLLEIARRLQSCIRAVDTVARFGGDEFTLLLEDVAEAPGAIRVAERIQEKLARPMTLAGREVFTSASMGIAMGSSAYLRPEELLRDADTAMYRAKFSGKARHEVFNVQMHDHALAELQLETELRRAVEARNFVVHYQPIVDLRSGSVAGFEALIRWPHPTRGLVTPEHFVPLAEETGLIVHIDRWVLQQACAQAQRWRALGGAHAALTLSVNVSKRDLEQPLFAREVANILENSGLPPEALALEITESAIMEHTDRVSAVLKQLRAQRVSLVMDDFGTGYSSLSYLHRLPFTSLKIDRSFITRLGTSEDTAEIVRAIVNLARGLKLLVTAEGVQTQEHLDWLRGLGCEFAQGFFLSEAVAPDAATALLERGPRW